MVPARILLVVLMLVVAVVNVNGKEETNEVSANEEAVLDLLREHDQEFMEEAEDAEDTEEDKRRYLGKRMQMFPGKRMQMFPGKRMQMFPGKRMQMFPGKRMQMFPGK